MAKGKKVGSSYAFSNSDANRATASSAKPRVKKGGPALQPGAGQGGTPGQKSASSQHMKRASLYD